MSLDSMDGKYVLAGGEDDLVQVWGMEERKVVAWGEGHNSWVGFSLVIMSFISCVKVARFHVRYET